MWSKMLCNQSFQVRSMVTAHLQGIEAAEYVFRLETQCRRRSHLGPRNCVEMKA